MRANVDAWTRADRRRGLEAIVVTTSGCGATIKDYGALLADDPAYADKAARVAALARDVTEYVAGLDLAFAAPKPLVVAYHAACTLQHGQKIVEPPKALLRRAGFDGPQPGREPPLLRLGGDLQHPPPRDRRRAARAQGRPSRTAEARRHRRRQHRLPDPDRQRDRRAGRPHGRAARLGERRPGAVRRRD